MISTTALRAWGIAVSAALMALSLAIGAQPAPAAQAAPETFAQAAQAERAPVAFVVRFRGEGPIARAQAGARQGDLQAAQRVIESQLQRQAALAGLCFDRFTAGAQEVVLRTCEPVGVTEQARVQRDWLTRLRAMRAVAYADANAAASPGRTG